MKKPRKGRFFVYILECSDKTYYTGYTSDLKNRLKEHNEGKKGAKYTRGRRPVKLVWKKEYKNKSYAMRDEAQIKKLTRKRKKELIRSVKLSTRLN